MGSEPDSDLQPAARSVAPHASAVDETGDRAAPMPTMVLHVLNSASGGAALSTRDLIVEFRRRGIRSCAVCDTGGTDAERRVLAEAVEGRLLITPLYWTNHKIRSAAWKRPIHELRQLLQTGFQRGSTRKVVQLARQFGTDLIHTNTLVTSEGGLAARRLGLPHVWHARELVGKGMHCPLWLDGPPLGRYLAEHASRLVANSETTAACLRPIVPEGLLAVVPNGIDIGRFQPHEGPIERDRIVVAMVASLTSRSKKHRLFVDAAARVDRSLPIEWRIYGHDPSRGGTVAAGEYVDTLHAQISRAGLTDRFGWPGFVSDPADVMSQIDVLVHPADNESFGRVAVEAMAAGIPVVGVRGGGVSETVEHGVTGLLAEPDNPRDLGACIEQLVHDPRRAQALGAAGRLRALARYSLAACTAGMLEVYRSAMARPLSSSTYAHPAASPR